MKNKWLFVITIVFVVGVCGCSTTDPKPPTEPDRGHIPILNPLMPPSMTNEWVNTNTLILANEKLTTYRGGWIGEQKLIIEANGKRMEYALCRPFGRLVSD